MRNVDINKGKKDVGCKKEIVNSYNKKYIIFTMY